MAVDAPPSFFQSLKGEDISAIPPVGLQSSSLGRPYIAAVEEATEAALPL